MTKLPFLPVPNTLQIEATYFTPGGFAENVYHVKGSGPITDLEGLAQSCADVMYNWENTTMKSLRSGWHGLHHVVVRDMGTEGGYALYDGRVVIGTAAGNPAPDNVTLAIKWATNRSGRSYRGRSYHIGFTINMFDKDSVPLVTQTPLLAAYNQLKTNFEGIAGIGAIDQQAGMVVVSKFHNGVQRDVAETTKIQHATLVDNYIDSQRRRLIGRGS